MVSPFLSLLLVLVIAGGMLAASVVALMAWAILHPPRMSDGKAIWVLKRLSPGDLGLTFEDVSFDVRDERSKTLRFAGWWIPSAGSRRCAVLLHGYADAKVGAIAWAPLWHERGFNILALDLRAHGQSTGTLCTGGYHERHDVNAVLNQLRTRRPDQTRQLVLFGISMGAAIATAVASERDDLAGLVLESPYADYATAVMRHLERLGAPGPGFQRAALALAERASGSRFAEVRPMDCIARVRCPVLAIMPADDAFLTPEQSRAMRDAITSLPAGQCWQINGVEHLGSYAADPSAYARRIADFCASLGTEIGDPPEAAGRSTSAAGDVRVL